MKSDLTIDGFSAYETLNHLENGGTIISDKRGDVGKYVDGKFLVFFYIGNKLSNEYSTFDLEYISTFKLVGKPLIETPVKVPTKEDIDNKLPLTLTEVKELAVKTLDIYRIGWETDNTVWIMRDNSMFSTNHGRLCLYTKDNLSDYIEEIKLNLLNSSEIASIIK